MNASDKHYEKYVIQYLWIENWHSFAKTELNFSSEYIIHYDNNGTLSLKNNKERYVSNFYGNNIDLSVVIGSNGVGKTSILSFIMAFSKGDNHIDSKMGNFIIVYKVINDNNEKLEIYYHDYENKLFCDKCLKELKSKGYCPKEIYPKKDDGEYVFAYDTHNRKEIKYIYYTNAFCNTGIEFSGEEILSPHALLLHAVDKNKNLNNKYYKYGFIDDYWKEENAKQINFIVNNKKLMEEFGINFPKKIIISVKRSFTTSDYLANNSKYGKLVKNDFESFGDKNTFDKELSKEILLSLLSNEKIREEYQLKRKLIKKYKSSILFIYDLLVELNEKLGLGYFEKYISFLDYYINNVKKSKMYLYIQQNAYFEFVTKDKRGCINIETFNKFISIYFDIGSINSFLSFNNWGLSSGESTLINIFSRLYSLFYKDGDNVYLLKENSNSYENNIVLLYDEAEISLHPEWQRKFLSTLLEFLKLITKHTHIQLIIATHSPIIVSDVLKQNIIFLEKNNEGKTICEIDNKHKETFGSNIFSLFNDTFILEEGAIGTFAEKKIVEIIDLIKKDANKNYDKIKQQISVVGDDFLRKKLMELLYKNANDYYKIKELENKINNAKNELRKLKNK